MIANFPLHEATALWMRPTRLGKNPFGNRSLKLLVRTAGLEPAPGFPGADFKSAASTFSPRPLGDLFFAQALLRIAAEALDQRYELIGGCGKSLAVGAAQY
jgi:hypothetical protein